MRRPTPLCYVPQRASLTESLTSGFCTRACTLHALFSCVDLSAIVPEEMSNPERVAMLVARRKFEKLDDVSSQRGTALSRSRLWRVFCLQNFISV